jgi:ABC-2 type transport system ATP-binding protein
VHELSLLEASLEEAFMELTRDDVEYHAHGGAAPEAPAQGDNRPPLAGWPTGPAVR